MGEKRITLPAPGLEDFDRLIPGIGRFILNAVALINSQSPSEVADTMLVCEGYLAFASQERAKAEIWKREQETMNYQALTATGPDGKPLTSATAAAELKYLTNGRLNESYAQLKLWEALETRLEGLRDTLLSYLRTLEKERERTEREI